MILLDQLPHLLAVEFWPRVTKLFLEGIAQGLDIAGFTKDQRDHQPIISRANLAIGTVIAVEGA